VISVNPMQSQNQKIVKNTLALYIRSLFLLLINLYVSRVTLQVLGVEDFGIYTLIGGVVQMFAVVGSALVSTTQRFVSYSLGEGDFKKLQKIFHNCLSLHIVLGVFFALVILGLGLWLMHHQLDIPEGRMPAARVVLFTTVLTFYFSMVSLPYNGLIIAHEKMKAFAYISLLEGILKLSSLCALKLIEIDHLVGYSVLICVISLLIQATYATYSKRSFAEAQKFRFVISSDVFKQIFSFAGWNLWGEGTMVLRNQGIDILINTFFGVTFNAAKGIANQVSHAVNQFVSNFQAAVRPQLTMSVAQKNYQRTYELIFQGSRFSFYLMMVFSVPLCISTREVLSLWLGEVPIYAVELVRWTLVYLLLDTLTRFSIQAINATGKIRNYQLTVGVLKLLTLPITYLFLKHGSSPTIGLIVNVVIEVVCIFMRLYFNKVQIGMDMRLFFQKVISPCVGVYLCGIILPILFFEKVSRNLFLVVPVAVLSSVCSIWFLGLSSLERSLLFQHTPFRSGKCISAR